MNVTGTEPQVCAPAGAASPVRDASAGNPATAADAAAFFLGLLAQATAAPVVAAMPAAREVPATKETDAADTAAAPTDWVAPFLPPLPALPPVPTRHEPSATVTTAEPLATLTTGSDDGTVVVLPAAPVVDEVGTDGPVPALVTADPARAVDAAGSAAVASSPPRLEATGNGETQAVVRHLSVPVNDRRWPEQVGHEVRILVERGVQAATLRLTPEHLGPVDVRIDIVNDKANVVFGAAHADTRAALSEAIPKLREMFAGAGLTLGDAGVRQDHPGQFSGLGPRDPRLDALGDLREDDPSAAVQAVRLGLVDAYA